MTDKTMPEKILVENAVTKVHRLVEPSQKGFIEHIYFHGECVQELVDALREIAKPALGGKQQQLIAKQALAKWEGK